ncbi:hypothetical protein MY11210_004770 [Beauveria gryllotalpidicola]
MTPSFNFCRIDKVVQRRQMGPVDHRPMRLGATPDLGVDITDWPPHVSHTRLSPKTVCVSFMGSGSASAPAMTKQVPKIVPKKRTNEINTERLIQVEMYALRQMTAAAAQPAPSNNGSPAAGS